MKNFTLQILSLVALLVSTFSLSYAQTEPHLNCSFVGKLPYPTGLSNLWHYVAPNGKEYALVGCRTKTSIVDVSTPTNPVEVGHIDAPQSTWREIRTFQHYAYVVTEESLGLTIIDLTDPANPTSVVWTGNNGATFSTEHTVFVDEPTGTLYVFGANHGAGGAIIADLNANPTNPQVIGQFNERYIHDGYVRNDTLWASEVNDGLLEVIDVTNKANPVVMASFHTPNNFTHNSALTADGKTLFTTDEVFGAYLASYDVSDISDIKLLDVVQSYREGEADLPSPHNVYTMPDNFIVCSYYTDGVQIYDATHPDNMVLVGYYDTSPLSDAEFEGDWGVAPYLPSGNLLLSDMQEGLFVVRPNYIHACFLFGNVTNSITGAGVPNATISILNTNATDQTDFSGAYGTGTLDAGYYTIVASAPGYVSDTIENVLLANGVDVTQNAVLTPLPTYTQTGTVSDPQGFGISGAIVRFVGTEGTVKEATTDDFGAYEIAGMYAGTYQLTSGKWGYKTQLVDAAKVIVTDNPPVNITLYAGYYDPFAFDFGWTTTLVGNTDGAWELGQPNGTSFNPLQIHPATDSPNDFDTNCYSTGNSGDVYDFVNDGVVTLTTPPMNLVAYQTPYLSFDVWFVDLNQNLSPTDDTLIVRLSNGTQTTVIDKIRLPIASPWTHKSYLLSNTITLSNTMSVIFVAKSNDDQDALEVAIDNFAVVDSSAAPDGVQLPTANANGIHITASPNPFDAQTLLTFEGLKEAKQNRLLLYNVLGTLVQTQTIAGNTTTLKRNNLPTGVYFYVLEQDGQKLSGGKVVVK